jgi:hypothetical protein
MFHVCQRGFMDCGVAVAAMLTGVTYEEVLDRWFGCMNVENGLREIALKRILEDITEIEWRISDLAKPWPQLSAYSFPDWPSAVVIEGVGYVRHYLAVKGRIVHDPLLAMPLLQPQYPNGDWRVQTVLFPVQPDRLQQHQWRRRARIIESLSYEPSATPPVAQSGPHRYGQAGANRLGRR